MAQVTEPSKPENSGPSPNKLSPATLVKGIVSLCVALGGPQIFTTWAPPTENTGFLRLTLIGISAAAWLVGLILATRWFKGEPIVVLNIRRILLVAIAVFLLGNFGTRYLNQWEAFTVEFDDERVLTGTKLTTTGKEYFGTHPEASREQAVLAAGGKAEEVWTTKSIATKRSELLSLFRLSVMLAVFCVILLFYCLTSPELIKGVRKAL